MNLSWSLCQALQCLPRHGTRHCLLWACFLNGRTSRVQPASLLCAWLHGTPLQCGPTWRTALTWREHAKWDPLPRVLESNLSKTAWGPAGRTQRGCVGTATSSGPSPARPPAGPALTLLAAVASASARHGRERLQPWPCRLPSSSPSSAPYAPSADQSRPPPSCSRPLG